MRLWKLACMIAAMVSIAAASAPVFFGAKLEPPAGRVISGWGNVEDLAAYSKAVAPHPPAMISFDVTVDFNTASGFLNGYREFAASHGFFIAQVGLSFRSNEHDVAIGMRDPDLFVIADGLRNERMPVLLSIGRDFNEPGAEYATSGYIGAFRHTAEIFHREDPSLATVWESSAHGFSDPHYMKWYPGDDVVDWWGIDLREPDWNRAETVTFLDEATHHHKPVMIDAARRSLKTEAEALKWYASVLDLVRAHPGMKAVSFGIDAGPLRWPKVTTYLKQQLADPRFIYATEAPDIFRRRNPAQ